MLAGACNRSISDTDYAREGIGVDLMRSQLPSQTELQNIYLASLCQQASPSLSAPIECDHISPLQWPLVVQAGLNDIDLRCDAYLMWIDNVRRSSAAALAEITDVGTAATAIMGVTGASAKSIAIVGTAFGLAYNTFTNVSHRLLLDVDKTTVQAVVYHRRNDFRNDLATQPPVTNRPAAIHALRSYLSICLPITIETDINMTVTVFQQTGDAGAGTAVVDANTVRSATMATRPLVPVVPPPVQIIHSNVPPPVTPPVAQQIGNPLTDLEKKSLSLADGQAIQRTLCIDNGGDFGPPGSPTRRALQQFYTARLYPRDSSAHDTIANTTELNQLRDAQAVFPSCKAAGLANAFEVGLFSRPVSASGTVDPMKFIGQVGDALTKEGLGVPTQFQSATLTPTVIDSLRQVIPQLRAKYNLPGDNSLDRALYNKIVRSGAN
jgi:hypothetical protein